MKHTNYIRASSSPNIILQIAFVLVLLCLKWSTVLAEDYSEVVLITHASSKASSISLLEIRRLYLGFPGKDPNIGKPIINQSNERLFEDFLKNIMHVTEDGYRRKIVRRVFRYGADYITELESMHRIVEHLNENPSDVVFIDHRDLHRFEHAKVLVRLW